MEYFNKHSLVEILRRYAHIILSAFLMFTSCSRDPEIESPSDKFVLPVPSNFSQPKIPLSNPMRKEIVDLGRQLFFDPLLSGNNKISCASCHLQTHAFADTIRQFSSGIDGQLTKRNA